MNFKVSFIALFLIVITFVGVPHEVEAGEIWASSTVNFSSIVDFGEAVPVGILSFDFYLPTSGYVRFFIQENDYSAGHLDLCFESDGDIRLYNFGCTTLLTEVDVDGTGKSFKLDFNNGDILLTIDDNVVSGASLSNYVIGFRKLAFYKYGGGDNALIVNGLLVDDEIIENYTLEYHLDSLDEEYAIDDIGCYATEEVSVCAISEPVYAVVIQSTSTSLITPWKYEFEMSDIDGNQLSPPELYAKTTVYLGLNTYYNSNPVIFPSKEKNVYFLNVCVGDTLDFPLIFGWAGTTSICKPMYIGQGYDTETLTALLTGLGKIASTTQVSSATIWEENGCDDIGLDIFKGIKCSFIWAFSPDKESISKFNEAKNSILTIYPIGYATLIFTDVTSSLTASSTNAFDKDIDVKKFFGKTGGTTTISVANLTSELGFVQPIIDYINLFAWSLFVGWLLWWGLTRKL